MAPGLTLGTGGSRRKAIEQWIDLESGGRLHVAAELTGPEKGHLHFAMMPHERSVVVRPPPYPAPAPAPWGERGRS